jgi:hypothetical protein
LISFFASTLRRHLRKGVDIVTAAHITSTITAIIIIIMIIALVRIRHLRNMPP